MSLILKIISPNKPDAAYKVNPGSWSNSNFMYTMIEGMAKGSIYFKTTKGKTVFIGEELMKNSIIEFYEEEA